MPKVFISYSSKDKHAAEEAVRVLEKNGLSCWIAPRNIEHGTPWAEGIMEGINSCAFFVLVFSENANESKQVVREVERAVNKGLVIFPVRLEDVVPKKSLEFFISSEQWIDAFPPPFEAYFESLGRTMQRLMDSGQKPPPAVPSPERTQSDHKTQQGRAEAAGFGANLVKNIQKWVNRIIIGFALVAIGFVAAFVADWNKPQVAGPTKTPSNIAASPDIQRVVLNGVTYTLDDWGWEGNALMFWVKGLNQKGDTTIQLSFDTSLVDDRGDRYTVTKRMSGDRVAASSYFDIPMTAGTTTRFGLSFEGVPPSMKTVQSLEITLGFGGGKIQFPNIPVAGRTLQLPP